MSTGVARVEQDKAGGIIGTGASTVLTNNRQTAQQGSIIITKPNKGDIIVSTPVSVFAENKKVAVRGAITGRGFAVERGSPNVFAGNIKAADVDTTQSKILNVKINGYVANPEKFNNVDAANNGVKQFYPAVQDAPLSSNTGNPIPSSSDLIPFLTARLAEGGWRESGQGGRPSNPKILNVWTELGFTRSSPWTTDQTPWCMGFVNYALRRTGYRWAPEASARSIQANPKRWNATAVSLQQMLPGDIVLWSFSHVNFCYTADQGRYTFVGGNQTPTSGVRNPNDGDLTISWPTGWTSSKGGIVGVFRPSKN